MSQQEMTTLAGEPLPVEFCLGTAWHAGVLIGWRHEEDGTAQVRVQFLIGGLRRTSWMQLTDLRLPEPEPELDARVPAPRPVTEPAPRPDLLLTDRDRSRPLPSVLPQPRSPDADLSRV